MVEVLHPFSTPTRIRQMKLLDNTASLYFTTEEGVLRMPVQRCSRYSN